MASPSSSAELAEPRASWIILGRVAGELNLPLVKRPRLSRLNIPSSFDGYLTNYGDAEHPYVIAANDAGLLLHVSPNPHLGFNLGPNPEGNLVVACDFIPEDGTGRSGALSATAVRVADRAAELSLFSGITSVGLLPFSSAGFVVAERHGRRVGDLVWFRSDEASWDETELTCPDVTPGANPDWIPHDVIAYDDKLCWVDLTRGLLVCNPLDPNPHLSFVALPELTALQDRHEGLGGIESCRIVRVTGGKLRFVDVVRRHGEPPEATRAVVWTLESLFDPSIGRAKWEHHQCMTTLEGRGHLGPQELPEVGDAAGAPRARVPAPPQARRRLLLPERLPLLRQRVRQRGRAVRRRAPRRRGRDARRAAAHQLALRPCLGASLQNGQDVDLDNLRILMVRTARTICKVFPAEGGLQPSSPSPDLTGENEKNCMK